MRVLFVVVEIVSQSLQGGYPDTVKSGRSLPTGSNPLRFGAFHRMSFPQLYCLALRRLLKPAPLGAVYRQRRPKNEASHKATYVPHHFFGALYEWRVYPANRDAR